MGTVDSASLYGTLNLLVLRVLDAGSRHGLGIAREIHRISDDVLRVEEGTLYPALRRLQRDRLVTAEWGTSENNRRAKFYSLTPKGRKRLRRESEKWLAHVRAVARVLEVEDEAPGEVAP